MDRGEKRSFDQVEDSSVAVYEFCKFVTLYRTAESERDSLRKLTKERPKFRGVYDLDRTTKTAALKASGFVVSLVSFSGENVISQGCGTIVETAGNLNTVMTSLNLIRQPTKNDYVNNVLADDLKIVVRSFDKNAYLAEICCYDYHYNLLVIQFKSKSCLPAAKLLFLENDFGAERAFLRPHSTKLEPGGAVVVVGRYFYEPFSYMASPGLLSMERHDPKIYDCTELLTVHRCTTTTRCGDGAPVINLSGEVFGITYYDFASSFPFLPITVAYKWWNHYKQFKEPRRPSYGFEGSYLSSAILPFVENFLATFPDITDGVLVEKVLQGSNAQTAGLLKDDVIVKCDDKSIKSFLELWGYLFEKAGDAVELQIARVSLKIRKKISMVVGETTSDKLNKWPQYD